MQVGRKPNEIFVSDGSKCDIGRLQLMFGADVSVALQVRGGAAASEGGGQAAVQLPLTRGSPPIIAHHQCSINPPATQDPAYPVYVDSSVIMGMTGGHDGTGFEGIQYMLCRPETDFFPDLSKVGAG